MPKPKKVKIRGRQNPDSMSYDHIPLCEVNRERWLRPFSHGHHGRKPDPPRRTFKQMGMNDDMFCPYEAEDKNIMLWYVWRSFGYLPF